VAPNHRFERSQGRFFREPRSGKPGLKFARAEAYLDVNCEAFAQSTSWLLEHAERVHDSLLVDLPTLAKFKAATGATKTFEICSSLANICPKGRALFAPPLMSNVR
jgi:hypothetical protein